MKILVINCGSSSLKYQLFNMDSKDVLAGGIIERIGSDVAKSSYKKAPDTDAEQKIVNELAIADHAAAMTIVINAITDKETGVIADASEIDAVGHRVVHGGEAFSKPTVITDEVIAAIEETSALAPLHNPANLTGIRVAMEMFKVPNVAVFDTAFHQTMPSEAYMYALPYELYEELKVRRYGFHGTSHKYVARTVAEQMGKNPADINVITVHLGNGGSIAAVKGGKCIDTTMGLTPLAGVVMGTRCGDIDPAIPYFLHRAKGLSFEEVDTLLNKKSGLMGICDFNDMRDIHSEVEKGNERAALAVKMFAYRNKKYIGAYMAALGSVDAIVFTAGIGENDDIVRWESCAGLENFGIKLDAEVNGTRSKEPRAISTPDSTVQVWVVPTDEELEIANETKGELGA